MFKLRDYDYRNLIKNSSGVNIKSNPDVAKMMAQSMSKSYLPIDGKRSSVDRLFDFISAPLYATAGAVRGAIRDDMSMIEGFTGGIKAGNPFGDGYERGEHRYSRVLEDIGWKPESTGGKVARGVLGFIGDVFLDPATYLTGGISALVKGTGRAGLKATHQGVVASKIAKDMGIDMSGKLAKDLPDMVFKKTVDRFANNPNVNKELVKRLATKRATSVSDELSRVTTGMTQDMAEKLITNQAKVRGLTLSTEDIVTNAKKLVTEHNRVIGLRGEARDLRWALEGAPFGRKIFGKHADKGFTIMKAETLQRLGEKSLAPQYAKIRNSIYGSKLGKLFSSKNSTLYNLSKTDPEAVYDFMKFTEVTRGLHKDFQLAKRVIHDKAKLMNLSPSETDDVIKMMEDKSIWSKVQKLVNFGDTEQAKVYRQKVTELYDSTQSKLDELTSTKANVEALQLAKSTELANHNEALDLLREEYRTSLADLNLNTVTQQDQVREVIKKYEEEIDLMKKEAELVKLTDNVEEFNVIDVIEEFDKYTSDLVAVRKHAEARREMFNLNKAKEVINPEMESANKKLYDAIEANDIEGMQNAYKVIEGLEGAPKVKPLNNIFKQEIPEGITKNHYTHSLNQVKKQGYVRYKDPKSARKFAEHYKGWEETFVNGEYRFTPPDELMQRTMAQDLSHAIEDEALKMRDASPVANKAKAIESISNYLYGKPDLIAHNTWDGYIEEVMKMIKSGENKDEILSYISDNSQFFNGRANEIYPFIAEQLGYKSWQKTYHDALKPIGEKLQNSIPLTIQDERLLAKLQQLNMKRKWWINTFDKARSIKEITAIKQEVYNKKMWEDFDEIKHMTNTFGRSAPYLDDVRRNRFLHEDTARGQLGEPFTRKTGEFIEKPIISELFSAEQRFQAYDDIMSKIFYDNPNLIISLDKIGRKHIDWVNKVTDEVEPLLKTVFDKPFSELSVRQKNYLYNLAIQNAIKRSDGSKLIGGIDEIEKLAIAKESKRRMEQLRIDVFGKQIKEGREVLLKTEIDGEKITGFIQKITPDKDGKPILSIIKGDGSTIDKVGIGQLERVFVNKSLASIDDLMKMSNITNDFVIRQDELSKLIDETKDTLVKLDANHASSYQSMIKDFTVRADDVKKRIKDIEVEQDILNKALISGDVAKIDDIGTRVAKLQDALASDDAFETFVRNWVSDAKVDKIISDYSYSISKTVLDTRTDISEKTRDIVKLLREEFIKMGKDEVSYGKLGVEQFENFMMNYLPHILTNDGEKLFDEAYDVLKQMPGFGDYLGYGRKFNPFAKSRTIKTIPDGKGGWIKNPNIKQINAFFNEKYGHILKGKNVISESIADIYVARALKNTELMYDQKYMETMMDTFGKNYTGVVEKGYNIAMNYGKYQQVASNIAKLNVAVDISDDITTKLSDKALLDGIKNSVFAEISDMVGKKPKNLYKKLFSKKLGEYVESYLKATYTDSVRDRMFKGWVENFSTTTNSHGLLDDLAVPMVELDGVKVNSIMELFESTSQRYLSNIRNSLVSYESAKYYETYNQAIPKGMISAIEKLSLESIPARIDKLMKSADEVDVERLNKITKKIGILNSVEPVQVKQINDAIMQKANQSRKLQIAKDQNRMLQLYDKVTHFIKLNQTTVLPSFHIRNKFSNTFNNWLNIGTDAVNLEFQKKSYQAMIKDGNVDGVLNIVRPDGSTGTIQWSELYRVAKDYGVIDDGYFAKDVGVGTVSRGLFKRLPVGYDPTDTLNFKLYKKSAEVGGIVEGQDRLLHFASEVSRGKSYEEALESVNKFLFDYSDLTAFEHSVMKRIMPYYTWLRKNSALQLEMMLEQPQKYLLTSKVMGGIEGMVDNEDRMSSAFVNDFAQDWIQTPFNIINFEGREEPVLWNPNLPYMDISRLPDVSSPKSSLQSLFTQTNPIFKTPIEQVLNRNMFFDSPIVKEGQGQILPRLDHVLSQLGLYGVAKDVAQKRGADLGLEVLNNALGVKMLSYDYDRFKAMRIDEILKREREKNK